MNIETICDQARIDYQSFSQYLADNTAKDLPYHGNDHLLDVAASALYLANGLSVTVESKRHLAAASLLHDINHTGDPTHTDRVNINRAVSFIKDHATDLDDQGLKPKVLIDLVKVTQHPSPRATRINDIIMQDADLLFLVREDDEEVLVSYMQKLSEETGKPASFVSTSEFISEHGFYSTPGWNLWQKSVWKTWKTADLVALDSRFGLSTV